MKMYIDDLQCRARIGIFPWEKKVKQKLILNVEMDVMNTAAAYSDTLDDAVSYKELGKELLKHIQSQHFGLIERVALECCHIVLGLDNRVTRVTVEVNKPGALSVSRNVRVLETLVRNQAIIGIGSNIAPEKNTVQAKKILAGEFNVLASARNHHTKAIARKHEPDFINTAVLIETSLDLQAISRRLKHIEWECGRQPSVDEYGKREIDLDILLWNQQLHDADVIARSFLRDCIEELLPGILPLLAKKNSLTLR